MATRVSARRGSGRHGTGGHLQDERARLELLKERRADARRDAGEEQRRGRAVGRVGQLRDEAASVLAAMVPGPDGLVLEQEMLDPAYRRPLSGRYFVVLIGVAAVLAGASSLR